MPLCCCSFPDYKRLLRQLLLVLFNSYIFSGQIRSAKHLQRKHLGIAVTGFLQAECPSCRPTNSDEAMMGIPDYNEVPFTVEAFWMCHTDGIFFCRLCVRLHVSLCVCLCVSRISRGRVLMKCCVSLACRIYKNYCQYFQLLFDRPLFRLYC